jgi:hypothetical protein
VEAGKVVGVGGGDVLESAAAAVCRAGWLVDCEKTRTAPALMRIAETMATATDAANFNCAVIIMTPAAFAIGPLGAAMVEPAVVVAAPVALAIRPGGGGTFTCCASPIASDALARRLFGRPNLRSDLGESHVAVISQQDCLAIGSIELVDQFVQQRRELLPLVCRLMIRVDIGVKHSRLGFAMLPPLLASYCRQRRISRCLVEPTDQLPLARKLRRLAMKQKKDCLGDILGQVRVAQLSPRDAEHPPRVPPHEIRERLVASGVMFFQQFNVGHLRYDFRSDQKRTILCTEAIKILPNTFSGLNCTSFGRLPTA